MGSRRAAEEDFRRAELLSPLFRAGTWQRTCSNQLSFSWERTAGVGIKNPVCIPSPAFFLPFQAPFRLSRSNPVSSQVVSQSSISDPDASQKFPLPARRKSSTDLRRGRRLVF